MIALLLFAHAALAFAQCTMPHRSAALALAAQPCHEEVAGANLCLAHCLSEDQRVNESPAAIAPPPRVAALVVDLCASLRSNAFESGRLPLPMAHAPPARIVFRSLLI